MPKPPMPDIASEISVRKLKQENSVLKHRLNDTIRHLEQCKFELDTAIKVGKAKDIVRPIQPRECKSNLREACWVALASDWHIEESVDADSVNGVNSYSMAIARRRVTRFFEGVGWLAQYHASKFRLRDGILWLGGDLISGYLRDEDLESNACSPVQAIATLHNWISEGIRFLLEQTETAQLIVVCNDGNHGRLTKKMSVATRTENSIEWMLYHFLAREFANEPRIKFILPKGAHTYIDIYGKVIRFHHGDNCKFGGGVGGILIPIQKAIQRWESVRHADITCLGHFHQYHDLSNIVINGSLIGYNPFALSIGARYEEPQQAFFLIDSKRGKCMPSTVWVKESK